MQCSISKCRFCQGKTCIICLMTLSETNRYCPKSLSLKNRCSTCGGFNPSFLGQTQSSCPWLSSASVSQLSPNTIFLFPRNRWVPQSIHWLIMNSFNINRKCWGIPYFRHIRHKQKYHHSIFHYIPQNIPIHAVDKSPLVAFLIGCIPHWLHSPMYFCNPSQKR